MKFFVFYAVTILILSLLPSSRRYLQPPSNEPRVISEHSNSSRMEL